MANLPTIFISYNSGSEFEQTLALRLQTIGAVHGFNIYLPDRHFNSKKISLETINRINNSSYYILFSTTNKISAIAEQEVQHAFRKMQNKSNIIIIYDAIQGKNMKGTEKCTELFFNRSKQHVEDFVSEVMNVIQVKHLSKQNEKALGGLLLAGIALLVLGAALQDK